MKDITDSVPWASFREVVEEIVRPPLDNVQNRVDCRIEELVDHITSIFNEVRDDHGALATALRKQAEVAATYEATSRQRNTQLQQSVAQIESDLREELNRVTALHLNAVALANADLSNQMRRLGFVLISLGASCVVLLVAVLAIVLTVKPY